MIWKTCYGQWIILPDNEDERTPERLLVRQREVYPVFRGKGGMKMSEIIKYIKNPPLFGFVWSLKNETAGWLAIIGTAYAVSIML